MRAVLRCFVGIGTFLTGGAFLSMVGNLWTRHEPEAWFDGCPHWIPNIVFGLATVLGGGLVLLTAWAIKELALGRWTETVVDVLIPKRKPKAPPLSELTRGSKHADKSRIEKFL
jgi:hypothetical protein